MHSTLNEYRYRVLVATYKLHINEEHCSILCTNMSYRDTIPLHALGFSIGIWTANRDNLDTTQGNEMRIQRRIMVMGYGLL